MQTDWLRRWLALAALALFAATWRLWTPQTVFPQIPFFAALRTVPGWVDWIALAGMFAGLLGLLLIPSEPRRSESGSEIVGTESRRHRAVAWSAVLFVGSLLVLILLDQHRLQVWAYQFAIVAIVIASLARASCSDQALSLLRLLTVGIYFWSAVSKLDDTFLNGLGPELLRGMLTAFGLEPGWMRADVATVLAFAFPLNELAVAALLAFRPTRKYGLIFSLIMHLLLLATLGPWGLDHSWGVLLWNVYFIGQNVLIFSRQASGGRQPAEDFDRSTTATLPVPLSLGRGEMTAKPAARLASWVVYVAVVLPVLEPFGWLDHWPGWAVYAPAGERVSLRLLSWYDRPSVNLPPDVRAWISPFMSPARLSQWSLDVLATPISPDGRFQSGVLLAIVERFGNEASPNLAVESRANRFTGERDTTYLIGTREIRAYADSFWLNTRSRKLGGW